MDRVGAFLTSLTTSHWIAVVAVGVAAISLYFNAANYLANRRERQSKSDDTTPVVKATINATRYEHPWRSVQLHIVPAAWLATPQEFRIESWSIERARLLRPRDAVLARAENDDYATGVFFPDKPTRELAGKGEGRPQRFALEFFMKFADEEIDPKAKFKVTFSHINKSRRRTANVWATEPKKA